MDRVWIVAACVLFAALAGCAAKQADVPEPVASITTTTTTTAPPAPVNQSSPVFPIHYQNFDCDAVVFVHAVDFPHANARLPVGYVASDLGRLLNLTVNLDRAAVGLITYECDDDDLGSGPHSHAALSVFIDAPVISGVQTERSEIFLDVYELHRFISSPEQAVAYAAAGWNHTVGIDMSVDYFVAEPLPDLGVDPRQPNPIIATSTGSINGTQEWTGGIGGGTSYLLGHETIRFWQDTPTGVSYQEFSLDRHGRGSAAGCNYNNLGPVAAALGRAGCDPGEGLGLGFQSFNVAGAFYHLPGVHA